MREVADIVGLDATHVLSLAGFYSLFYEAPVGRYVLEVCNDLACALRGADEFVDMASRKLDIPVEGTTNDGLFTLKTVMCLGGCDRAPMLQCNLKFYENLDETKFEALIAELRTKAAAPEPSVVERIIGYAEENEEEPHAKIARYAKNAKKSSYLPLRPLPLGDLCVRSEARLWNTYCCDTATSKTSTSWTSTAGTAAMKG
jgi:hypothetical protein